MPTPTNSLFDANSGPVAHPSYALTLAKPRSKGQASESHIFLLKALAGGLDKSRESDASEITPLDSMCFRGAIFR